jgi:PQQ-like domain
MKKLEIVETNVSPEESISFERHIMLRAAVGIVVRRQLIVPILGFTIVLLILAWPIAAKCLGDCAPPSEWPQFQHDGRHTGYNAQETYLSMLNVGSLVQHWKSGPFSLDSSGYQVDPVVRKGVLYVTEIANRAGVVTLHALNARTGAPLWNTQLSFAEFTSVSPAAVLGDVIYLAMSYAASPQNYYLAVAAVSATTHQLVWTSTPNVHTNPVLINGSRSYTLTVNNGVVAVCATGKSDENHFVNGTMLTYKAKTGALLATHLVEEFCIPPVVAGTRVYYPYPASYVTAADVNSLATLWSSYGFAFGLALGKSGYLIANGGNRIRAWDHLSGAIGWELQPAPASSGFLGLAAGTPAVANGFAYVITSPYRLYKLYESGGVVWTLVIVDETIESAPALANDVLFLIAGGKLIALNATTGYILYSHTNADGAPFVGTPAIANGMVYVHAADAKGEYIYAFAPPVRDGA